MEGVQASFWVGVSGRVSLGLGWVMFQCNSMNHLKLKLCSGHTSVAEKGQLLRRTPEWHSLID